MTNDIQTQFIIKPIPVETGDKLVIASIEQQGYVVIPTKELVTLGTKIRLRKEGESDLTVGNFIYIPKKDLRQLVCDLQDYISKNNIND